MLCPKATSNRHSELAGRSWVETVDERVGVEMEVWGFVRICVEWLVKEEIPLVQLALGLG